MANPPRPPRPMRSMGLTIRSIIAAVIGIPDPPDGVKVTDRWENSERRKCVALEWRDEDGCREWDCLYASDVTGRALNEMEATT